MFVAYSKLFSELGYQVVCIIPKNFCDKEQLDNINCHIEFIDIKNYFDVFSALYLRQLIERYQPVYLLSHNGRSHSLINLWRRFFSFNQKNKVRTIGICHGCTKRMHSFEQIICVNQRLVDRFRQSGYQGKLSNIPCFLPDGINSLAVRATVKESRAPEFVFGILSRLSEEKNIALAIDALAEISARHQSVRFRLLIAGDGACKKALALAVKTKNLQDKVTFCGWIADVKAFFNDIDVLLLPSTRESFGRVILEAFQYATPVIASDTDGPSQIIRHGKNGLLFGSGNLCELTENMLDLWSFPELSKRLIACGQKDLVTFYTETAVKKKLQDILR